MEINFWWLNMGWNQLNIILNFVAHAISLIWKKVLCLLFASGYLLVVNK